MCGRWVLPPCCRCWARYRCSTAWGAVAEGRDVYLFLVGMMVLAELARREGLFDWLALYAVRHAGGSGDACSTWCSWSARW
jgi:Na+/H+ antiporter NhaD/arsenite permease-like protein